ncbi:MAG: TraR/DksA family transcriptional regulator [Nitrospirae bacterium]|nr:TraR/DksA family transcriptional regulator [Nitrospirota bacterium]
MASAKKKAPAAKKAKVQVKTKAVKAAARAVVKKKVPTGKKAEVQVKVAVKKKIINTKAAATAKPRPRVQSKVKAAVKAAAKKAVVTPSRKKIVPQKKSVAKKTGKTSSPAIKTAASKKGPAVVPATERFRGLKGMLVAKRDALLKEAKQEIQKYVSGENRQLVDTAIDEADWAAVEISEDINLKRLSAQRQLLNDVEECLRKLNEGTYGVCEDCGEEISEKRLHVIPTATLCIDCKEQREKMAILEQETEV